MIDIHTHLHPPRLAKAIQHWFLDKAKLKLTHDTEPHKVAAVLRSHNVERFVFCSYAHKQGMARELNEWLIATAGDLKGYGLPLATVFLDDPDYLDYYKAALARGCVGLKIHEDVQSLAIDDPRMDAVHQLTVDHEGMVLVHVGHVPWTTQTNDGPRRVASVLTRHPKLKVVVAHFGVPDSQHYLDLTAQHPNLYLDTTMAMTRDFPLLANTTREILSAHSKRILFGSDYPINHFPYETEPDLIRKLKLQPQDEERIFVANAKAILAPHW
jgi:predicted TIM-barrel fold metal-dependent hydrolase